MMPAIRLEEAIEEFVAAGVQRGWSKATHYQYTWHLSRFRQWCSEHDVSDPAQLDRRRLRLWGASLVDGWSLATQRLAVTTVKGLLHFCHQEGFTHEDPGACLKAPRPKKKIQRTLKTEEILKLLQQCQVVNVGGVSEADAMRCALRNAAIISLLYDSLLRASELCRLTIDKLDLERRRLVVVIKGGNEGVGQFSQETADRLRAWLGVRQAAEGVDTVFVSVGGKTPGRPLKPVGLRLILLKIGKRAGVPKVTPHAFRRGGARAIVRNGASERVAQEFGRWQDTSMVRLYTRDLDAEDLYDRYSPVAHLPAPQTLSRKTDS
jgi:integrase/recombinase XerC